ncbi:MAG: T9SS type A sorting domain-containing protein [Bacteroidetes bacterium]|nr:T9SS type A sorting domain-containing protein [Bacteroidota bacterium]
MKNKYIVMLAIGGIAGFASAQMPNPDFENWTNVVKNTPAGWTCFGLNKKVTGIKGGNAVRLQSDPKQQSGPGAVIYGNPDQNFSGGIAYSGRPDSAVGFFKIHMEAGDTAWYLVFLKHKGQFLSQNIFPLYGNDTSVFRRLAFAIPYSDTGLSDTLIIGVSSTNPNNRKLQSVVFADSLQLITGSNKYAVPNGGFELWGTSSWDDLQGWYNSNAEYPNVLQKPVTKSTDRVYGSYAARITNVDLGGGVYGYGYILAGRQGNDGPLPGFPVSGKDSMLYVNYKFYAQGDTMNIGILMYENGNMVGNGFLRQWVSIPTYTQAAIPIAYIPNYSGTPDSAAVFCAAFVGGGKPHGPSILTVDGFQLNTPLNAIRDMKKLNWELFPNPAQSTLYIKGDFIPAKTLLNIYDLSGKCVLHCQSLEFANGILQLDISKLNSGLYFLNATQDSEVGNWQFVIEK